MVQFDCPGARKSQSDIRNYNPTSGTRQDQNAYRGPPPTTNGRTTTSKNAVGLGRGRRSRSENRVRVM